MYGRVENTALRSGDDRIRRGLTGERASSSSRRWLVPTLAASAAALGAAAVYNVGQAREAERQYPPIGRFIAVDGVRLHFIERGQGEPLVLLHGNGSLIQDFLISGIVDRLAERYRVIVIERPGYGYSTRPRRLWTPRAQAHLLQAALERLGVNRALVFGHSWGTLVALALALENPSLVRGLVLASGYYYPTGRGDVLLFSPPAVPVLGDIMRYTISPLAARLLLPRLFSKIFAPQAVPERFDRLFPKALLLRPSQIRAASEEAAMMIPAAMGMESRYRNLTVPTVIVTGTEDRIVDPERQSARLHEELPDSRFIALPGLGHMIHHLAPEAVIEAIDQAAQDRA